MALVVARAGDRWWRQLAGGRSRMSVVAPAFSHHDRAGDAAPQVMLVVVAAQSLRQNVIIGEASQIGCDMAAVEVGGGPSLVAGSRSSSR